MANVLQISWREKNPKMMETILKLKELYDHDETVFSIGDLPPPVTSTKPQSNAKQAKATEMLKNQDKGKQTRQTIDANKEGIPLAVIVPMQEDFQVNLQSNFKSVEEMLPSSVGSIVSTGKKLFSAVGGTNDFMSMFGLQVWEETKPIELSLELTFHTQKNGWLDVWAPVMSLAAMSILSVNYTRESDGGLKAASSYRTPGVNLGNSKFFLNAAKRAKETDAKSKANKKAQQQASDTQAKSDKQLSDLDSVDKNGEETQAAKDAKAQFAANAKTVLVEIPGILDIGTGMITSAKPTFSKELTELGAPLWGKIDFTVMSVMPAFDELIFKPGMDMVKDLKKKTIGSKLQGFVRNAF